MISILALLFVAPPLLQSGGEPVVAAAAVDVAHVKTSKPASNTLARLSPEAVDPELQVSPDGSYVVYRSSIEQLSSLRIRDGSRAVIAPPPACSNMHSYFQISSDSRKVLFTCPAWTGVPTDLWAVPIEGPPSAALRLSLPADAPYQLGPFYGEIVKSRFFYHLPHIDPFRIDLYSVPVDGPPDAGTVINAPLSQGTQTANAVPLPLTSRVLYLEWNWPKISSIWSAAPDGSRAVRIAVSPASHPITSGFLVSPNEQRVVWYAHNDLERFWLYSATISDPAGSPTQLNLDLPPDRSVGPAVISPDSTRVAFLANQDSSSRMDLYSIPIDGPPAIAINLSELTQPWYPEVGGVQFSDDSASIYYVGDLEIEGRYDLYRVPTEGPASAAVRINPVDAQTWSVDKPSQIPGTNDVLFELIRTGPGQPTRCFRGDLLGGTGTATPLWSIDLQRNNNSVNCRWLPESGSVLFVSYGDSSASSTLWLAHGSGPPDSLPKKLLDSGEFEFPNDPFWRGDLTPTPDGRYLVYSGKPLGSEDGVWLRPLPYFWDGFESGGTGHWTEAAGDQP